MPQKQYNNIWNNDNVDGNFKTSIPENVRELFADHDIQNVLDLGSGDGDNAVALALDGKNVHAIEISHEGVNRTLEKAQKANVNVHVLEQDMYQDLPFENGSLDAVIAFQSINHNTLPEIETLFAEITRVLKKSGLLVVKTANYEALNLKDLGDGLFESHIGGFTSIHRFLDEQTYVPQDGPEKGLLHYVFKPEQLVNSMEKLGYTKLCLEILQWHILAVFRKN